MNGKRRIRPTYANVVASLALFAALGGSSYAAISVTGKQVRDGSLSGRDVRNGSLTAKDVRDRSLLARDFKAGQLPAGPQGTKGDTGAHGVQGVPGTARAYAHVKVNLVEFIAARTNNFTSVSHAGAANSGRYCLTPAAGIDPATRPAVVSPDHSHSSGGDLAAYVEQPSFLCAANQFEVLTQKAGANSDDVAFTIIVP